MIQDQRYTAKLLRTIYDCYHRAPYFTEAFDFISSTLLTNCAGRLDQYLYYTIQRTCNYLNIATPPILSSEIPKDSTLQGEDKVIDICKILGATQ